MTKKQTLVLKLRRHQGRPWGFRIAGGTDLGTPIIVTHSENDELQKGDVIKKIDEYDSRDVRHVDAQNLLQNSQSVKLVVERPKVSQPKFLPKSPVPPLVSSREYKAFSPDHFDPPREHLEEVREERFYLSQSKRRESVVIMPGYTRTYRYTIERQPKDEEAAIYWPYRTTPLVLPGAKVKKDAPLGECYLRHHPNPMIRAAPHHYEVANPEVAMKQKVVHKQFNSPIGLYSDQNIADTIKCQTTAIPSKKPVKYDPSKSEAYKALQEEEYGDELQEVSQPARTGLFAPQRAHHNRVHHPPPKSPASSYASGYDDDGEKIHQSNSFKRIMYSVLGQTDY